MIFTAHFAHVYPGCRYLWRDTVWSNGNMRILSVNVSSPQQHAKQMTSWWWWTHEDPNCECSSHTISCKAGGLMVMMDTWGSLLWMFFTHNIMQSRWTCGHYWHAGLQEEQTNPVLLNMCSWNPILKAHSTERFRGGGWVPVLEKQPSV